MNRVIHINFQGHVIPIEESAAELLRDYNQKLRAHFASEEGADEILSDIEQRIAELFLQRLKIGASCITDNDMNEIMASIGLPEDLQAAEETMNGASNNRQGGELRSERLTQEKRRLYRAENDQIVGGVCAGIADYLKIDPAIVRVLFVLCLLAGFGFVLYLVFWVVLPAQHIPQNWDNRRRLFRNPEDKKIGGVASGLAAYFDLAVWVPRVIFLTPILLAILGDRLLSFWGREVDITDILFPGFGGTLVVLYLVLWAVLPEANTSAEKLQMRGEKVDLASIQKTVVEEMEHLKNKAEKWSKEASKRANEKAKIVQQDLSTTAKHFSNEASRLTARQSKGIGYGLGIFAKVLMYGLVVLIVITMLGSLATLSTGLLTGHQVVDYLFINETEKNLLWAVLILMIGVPAIGLLVWLIKALRGMPSNKYVGYSFTFLHTVGWACLIYLIVVFSKHFNAKAREIREGQLQKPSTNKLYLRVSEEPLEEDLLGWKDDSRWPKLNSAEDSVLSRNIRVKVMQSKDSVYKIRVLRMANGNNPTEARAKANAIQFAYLQQDSILYLPPYIRFPKKDKFYAQQLLVVIEMPIGAKLVPQSKLREYDWNEINISTGNGFSIQHHDYDDDQDWKYDEENEMKAGGFNKSLPDTDY